MRKRAPRDRVLPRLVVECVRPSLLAYICKYMLKKKYQTDKPETVSALVIHRWVMKKSVSALAAEDNEGIKQIKEIKIELSGSQGVRNVQRAFMQVDEIKQKYRLKTAEKEGLVNGMYAAFGSCRIEVWLSEFGLERMMQTLAVV